MGRTKRTVKGKSSSTGATRRAGSSKGGPKRAAFSVDALIEQGNLALNKLQPELAVSFFERAHEMAPENTNVMDALADVLIQLGQPEEAQELLLESTALAPDSNPCKWLFLAQLQSGGEALQTYRTGVDFLARQLREVESEKGARDSTLRRQLARAYCSIAELFLTDLCYEDNAEQSCEEATRTALEVDPESLDGLQAVANLRLSQSRKEEAVAAMKTVYDRLMALRDKLRARSVVQELAQDNAEDDAVEELLDLPGIDFYIAASKLLVECGDPESSSRALELAMDLLNDNDENIELWYIIGVAAMGTSPQDVDTARHHFSTALDMMDAIKESCKEDGEAFPYDEQYGLILEHLRLLGAPAAAAASGGEGAMDVDGSAAVAQGAADEEWEIDEEN